MRTSYVPMLFVLAAANAHAAVVVDPKLWTRIDAVNAALATETPADQDGVVKVLEESVEVMRSFDPEYQRIRADAFNTDFKQAEALAKRAAPGFVVGFDGDSDTEAVSLAAFTPLAPAGSAFGKFLALYKQTHGALGANGEWNKCRLPFDLPATNDHKAKKARPAALKKWTALLPNLPEGFLKTFATGALECLK